MKEPLPVRQEDRYGLMHKALCFGLKDYFEKHGFKKAILGLSGGIDSAVVAAIAAEALGGENVTGLLMPSRFSTGHSVSDARELAENLHMPHHTIEIKDIYDRYMVALKPLFRDEPFNVAEENIQSRSRGMLVMALSNKFGYIALNTSNKSEASVGYGTLYGDLCGSLGILGDVYKTEVYGLAGFINREKEIIPVNTITKAPSAELRPDQKDSDSLPDYDTMDKVLKMYVEEKCSREKIVSAGFEGGTVDRIIGMVRKNEYKRAQCPPVIKISDKTYRCGRYMPF